MQEAQKLMVDFNNYPSVFLRMVNSCIQAPQTHIAVLLMEPSGAARLDFIQVPASPAAFAQAIAKLPRKSGLNATSKSSSVHHPNNAQHNFPKHLSTAATFSSGYSAAAYMQGVLLTCKLLSLILSSNFCCAAAVCCLQLTSFWAVWVILQQSVTYTSKPRAQQIQQ